MKTKIHVRACFCCVVLCWLYTYVVLCWLYAFVVLCWLYAFVLLCWLYAFVVLCWLYAFVVLCWLYAFVLLCWLYAFVVYRLNKNISFSVLYGYRHFERSHCIHFLGLLDPEGESSKTFWNAGYYPPSDTTSYPGRLQYSVYISITGDITRKTEPSVYQQRKFGPYDLFLSMLWPMKRRTNFTKHPVL